MFAEAGVDRQLAVETDSAVAVCAMVQHGLGLAIVNPLTALALSTAGAGIEVRPLTFSIPFRVFAVRPAHRPGNPLVARFEAALQAECDGLARAVARAWGRRGTAFASALISCRAKRRVGEPRRPRRRDGTPQALEYGIAAPSGGVKGRP